MPKYTSALTAGLIATFLTILSSGASEQDVTDFERYGECVKRLFKLPGPDITTRSELVVSIGVVDDACQAQIHITLLQAKAGHPVSVRVLLAYPESAPPIGSGEFVPDQDCPMVRERSQSSENVLGDELSSHLEKLVALRLSPVPEPVLWLHGIKYEFHLKSPHATTKFDFWAPANPKPGEFRLHELDLWTRQLLELLQLDCSDGTSIPVRTTTFGKRPEEPPTSTTPKPTLALVRTRDGEVYEDRPSPSPPDRPALRLCREQSTLQLRSVRTSRDELPARRSTPLHDATRQ